MTKNEMNAAGAQIPSAWLILIVNIWWLWKFCEGVDHVTKGKMSAGVAFILFWLVGLIGTAIVQHSLNKEAHA
ncbi:MAG: hypothetical protein AB7U87_06055 [Candidatus Bipolaricaulis sp.]